MVRIGLLTALGVMIFAATASAQFLAADLIYVPGVAHTNGEGESVWRSELFITNVETDASVDVAMIFIETGLTSNASAFVDRSLWVGGREEDGFGFVDESLADIPPGGTITIRDPIGRWWGAGEEGGNSGAVVVFVYEADSLEDDGTRVLKNGIVNSRVFTPSTFYQPDPDNDGEFVEVTGTYGQTMPGVPWYNLADTSAVDEDTNFSFQILTGATQDSEFRYNVGILNASDPLTTLTVLIQPLQGNGEPFLDGNGNELIEIINMPPASHVQYNSILLNLFGIISPLDDVRIDVSAIQWVSGNSQPVVGMTVYGTFIDNSTNDPTAILPAFAYPYDIECQWGPSDVAGDSKSGGLSRRPVEIPAVIAEN